MADPRRRRPQPPIARRPESQPHLRSTPQPALPSLQSRPRPLLLAPPYRPRSRRLRATRNRPRISGKHRLVRRPTPRRRRPQSNQLRRREQRASRREPSTLDIEPRHYLFPTSFLSSLSAAAVLAIASSAAAQTPSGEDVASARALGVE